MPQEQIKQGASGRPATEGSWPTTIKENLNLNAGEDGSPTPSDSESRLDGGVLSWGQTRTILAFVNPSATAVWPCSGRTGAMLILGYEIWPGILLGAFLVNFSNSGAVATSAAIAVEHSRSAGGNLHCTVCQRPRCHEPNAGHL